MDYTTAIPSFRCKCPIGFSASLCEISEHNACDSGPCQNGGACRLKSLQDYTCSCVQGYSGKTLFQNLLFNPIFEVSKTALVKPITIPTTKFDDQTSNKTQILTRPFCLFLQANTVKSKTCARHLHAATAARAFQCPAVISNVTAQKDSKERHALKTSKNATRYRVSTVELAETRSDLISK